MATEVPGDHPRRRALSRGVLSPIRAYSTPQARATPAIMRSFHPSTNGKHRVLASSPFRLRLSRPCHSDQTPRGTRSSCTCIRGAARARCARESGRLRESLREREREKKLEVTRRYFLVAGERVSPKSLLRFRANLLNSFFL